MGNALKIGFAGGGKMAEAIIKGLIRSGKKGFRAYDPSAARLSYLRKEYKTESAKSNVELMKWADILILAVKPAEVDLVCSEIRDDVKEKLVISIAAGITISRVRRYLGSARVVRTMPNTPAFVGKGMTVIASSPATLKKDIAAAGEIFSQVGDVLVMDEKYLDAVTALSGSGPAFISLFIEALVDGAVKAGIQRDNALKLAMKTAEGTLAMLGSGIHTAQMREMVTSPGGTTAEGLFVLEKKGFKGIVSEAIGKACERASSLAQ
jgi:pyrroline-5-carboxylate reductase